MFNFPTEDIAKAFGAFSEAINQLAADIVDAWEAVTMTVSAVLDDDALWPNRYGMPPKKYGQSLQKHSKKSFKQYDYIPIMAKNLPVTIYLSRKSCSQQRAETSRCLSC